MCQAQIPRQGILLPRQFTDRLLGVEISFVGSLLEEMVNLLNGFMAEAEAACEGDTGLGMVTSGSVVMGFASTIQIKRKATDNQMRGKDKNILEEPEAL